MASIPCSLFEVDFNSNNTRKKKKGNWLFIASQKQRDNIDTKYMHMNN
jgi:hypothetical protein